MSNKFEIVNILLCPSCKAFLEKKDSFLLCLNCKRKYFIEDGVYVILPRNLTVDENYQSHFYNGLYSQDRGREIYDTGFVGNMFFEMLSNKYFLSRLNTQFKSGDSVLDIGCGGGNIARHLNKGKNINLVNLDISKHALRYAMNFKKDNYSYVQGSAFSLPFADNSFDYVLAGAMLHHINNLKEVLNEVKRVLKPRGKFVAFESTERYPWINLWLDFFHMPKVLYAKIENLYNRIKKRFHKKDPMADFSSFVKDKPCQSQRHFFKNIAEYRNFFYKVFGKSHTTVKPVLLEYLPPRFYFIKNVFWVKFYLFVSDLLSKSKFLEKRARFVLIEAKKEL